MSPTASSMEQDAGAAVTALLDRAGAAGLRVELWWRDDDAVQATPALDRLLARAERHRVPLALAVIPAHAEARLAARLRDSADVVVLQHGHAHANHEPPGAKTAELGPARPVGSVLAELAASRDKLAAMFGPRFLPVLVPPWNRAAPAVLDAAPATGYRAVSLFGRPAAPGRVDTHLDPVAWRAGRGFAGVEATIAPLAAAIADAVAAGSVTAGPVGLLTHHLVQDEPTWAFLEGFLAAAAGHPAADWPALEDLFAPEGPALRTTASRPAP